MTKEKGTKIEWVVYCMDCKMEIYRAPNGAFAEAYAETHKKVSAKEDDHSHTVLVGYIVK